MRKEFGLRLRNKANKNIFNEMLSTVSRQILHKHQHLVKEEIILYSLLSVSL